MGRVFWESDLSPSQLGVRGISHLVRKKHRQVVLIDREQPNVPHSMQVGPEKKTVARPVRVRAPIRADVSGLKDLFNSRPGDRASPAIGTQKVGAEQTLTLAHDHVAQGSRSLV